MQTMVVSGGSGFVASWVMADLLNNSYAVRASLRNLAKGDQVKQSLASVVSEDNLANLSFFEADLTSPNGWQEAMTGADGVMHVASPLGHGTETTEEMVAVAKGGTQVVFNAAKAAGVRRIVMTSSEAASTPEASIGAVTLDESFWTDLNNPELDPYRISKVEAEHEAWRLADELDLDLSTIMPGAIFGPVLNPKQLSSDSILLRLMKGQNFVPHVPLEVSDVRDLGSIHRLAMANPAAIGHRFIAADQKIMMADVSRLYAKNFPELKLHPHEIPNWTMRIAARFTPSLRSLVPMMTRQYSHTAASAEQLLGWKQHTPEETVLDTAKSLKAAGLLDK